jgi:3-methyl-2-oxobutanoate hydroxymethyltransferase
MRFNELTSEGIDPGGRDRLIEDAYAVEQAGACALVIEGVPANLAREITNKVSIPTIGIGAGIDCDGQVLVLHDALGLSERSFSFAKAYAQLRTTSIDAITQYVAEVRTGVWPDDSHTFH